MFAADQNAVVVAINMHLHDVQTYMDGMTCTDVLAVCAWLGFHAEGEKSWYADSHYACMLDLGTRHHILNSLICVTWP